MKGQKPLPLSYLAAMLLLVLLLASACASSAKPVTGSQPPPEAVVPMAPPTAPGLTAAPTARPAPRPSESQSPVPTVAPAAKVLPRRGGAIALPIDRLLHGTDPHTTLNLAKEVWEQTSDNLVAVDPRTFELKPALVESWSVSDQGRTITLNIRRGVRWQDVPPVNGREFTAEDAVYNLKRIAGGFPLPGKTFFRASGLNAMEDAVATDRYTVKLTLKAPSVALLGALANVFSPMVPKELVDQCGGTLDNTLKCTIGTGPFILKRFEDGVGGLWDRNPTYWKTGEDGKALPYLDQVRWIWFGDIPTTIAAVAVGKIAMYQRAEDPEVRNLRANEVKVRIVNYDKGVLWSAMFNVSKPPFNNLRVRTAIDLVQERQKSLNNVQGDTPWELAAALGSTYGSLALPLKEFSSRPGFREDKTEDVKVARRLLEEAGYGPNNLLRFKIYSSASGTCGRSCAILISDQVNTHLKGLALTEPAPVPNAARIKLEADGNFEFMFRPLAAVPEVSDYMISNFHSKGERNSPRYQNPEMDRLLEEQDRTYDYEKRQQLLWQAQRLILDERPYITWGVVLVPMVMVPNLMGWVPGPDVGGGDIYYNLDTVWLGEMPTPNKWPILERAERPK